MGLLKDEGVVYKPVDEVDLGPDSDEVYISADVKAPRMAGLVVKIFAWLLEIPIFGGILTYFLKKKNLFHKLVSFAEIQEDPLFVPLHPHHQHEETLEEETKYIEPVASPPQKVQCAVDCLPPFHESALVAQQLTFRRWTVSDYAKAYASGETTPTTVARWFIEFVRESSRKDLQMSFFINLNEQDILEQAAQSTARYKRGEPISALDGVPIAVKDEIDCLPYPTTGGTKWIEKVRKCTEDARCVSRLRLCGALIVGKTNMHELGAGISGINPHYGAARNPYNKSRITGGSSSGSAAVVAAGLCPVALGVDGGGSVRLPAALCGVVGFKPTFARIPHEGVLPINYTIGMVGILAATVEDALIVYAAISGDTSSHHYFGSAAPKIGLPLLKSINYMSSNIKMARYGKWFDDCSDSIRACCSDAVAKLCNKYNWKTIEVTIPEIEAMRLAHYITIASECSNAVAGYLNKSNKSEIGWDVRVGLAVYASFHSHEYLNAQRMRNRLLQIHQKIFSEADVIVVPTVGVTAYKIEDDAIKTGELDYINGAALVRYQIAGNFLGLPAVTVPVGYDDSGLPIGLQFIGKPWSESLLMHIASGMQALSILGCKRPEIFYDMLTM